jgi:tryptophan synthase beta chain
VAATDREAMNAFVELARLEGIIPALESSHAIAHVLKIAPQFGKDVNMIVCLSGRGDRSGTASRYLEGVIQ